MASGYTVPAYPRGTDFLFMIKRVAPLVLLLLVLLPGSGWSGAVLLIYPTEIVFDGRDRSAEVTLTNRGDAIGTFETSWMEMGMRPEGVLQKRESDEWSIQPYVRYSPRRVTLDPGESQIIKIALRPDSSAAEGEYYTHMRILTLNEEDLATFEDDQASPEQVGVAVKARSAIAIPVIWRNSASEPEVAIDTAEFDAESDQVAVTVRRAGRLSARAYLHVVDRRGDGTVGPIGGPIQVVIYPNLETRDVRIPINEKVDLSGAARVVLSTDELITDQTTLASVPLTP
jgi:P pilus assembly chaperone PapD